MVLRASLEYRVVPHQDLLLASDVSPDVMIQALASGDEDPRSARDGTVAVVVRSRAPFSQFLSYVVDRLAA